MQELTTEVIRELIAAAEGMLALSYSPYSHFAVGAALLGVDGRIYTGCNIENAGYSSTICAERTAVFKAVSEGVREFRAIAVAGGRNRRAGEYCPPCGVCRQVLAEFCPGELPVILSRSGGDYRVLTLAELLPESFGPGNLSE